MNFYILFFSSILFASSQLFSAEHKPITQKCGLFCSFKDLPSGLESEFTQLPYGFDYPRDYSFPLKHIGGKQYIPRQVGSDIIGSFDYYKFAILPGFYIDEYDLEIAKHKTQKFKYRSISSTGFEEKFPLISKYFDENNIAYFPPGQTIIEGGNIFFTRKKDSTTIAIIGDHALFLTYLAFEINDNWPLDKLKELSKNLPKETKLHYQLAQNMELFAKFVPQMQRLNAILKAEKKGDYSDSKFRQEFFKLLGELQNRLLTPLNEEEKLSVEDEARLATAKLVWCKQQIASEISLEEKNIVYLPQRSYHIDFDCIIGANNKVFLRSPKNEPEEKALWNLALATLKQQLPYDLIGDVPENLSDRYIFCGFYLSSKGIFLHPPAEIKSVNQCNFFLRDKADFCEPRSIGSRSLYENLGAGFHCMTQEYFSTVNK